MSLLQPTLSAFCPSFSPDDESSIFLLKSGVRRSWKQEISCFSWAVELSEILRTLAKFLLFPNILSSRVRQRWFINIVASCSKFRKMLAGEGWKAIFGFWTRCMLRIQIRFFRPLRSDKNGTDIQMFDILMLWKTKTSVLWIRIRIRSKGLCLLFLITQGFGQKSEGFLNIFQYF